MIKSLSPYYLYIPFVSPLSGLICTEYTLKIYAWNGAKTSIPATVTYQITKQNPTGSNADDKIDIARLINDFIIFRPQKSTTTELIDGNNQYWVYTEVYYTTADPLDYVAQLKETNLLLRGYGYGMDGENAQTPTNKILLSGNEFKVNRNGFFSLPILIEEPTDTSSLVLDSVVLDTGSTFIFSFTSNFTFANLYSQVRIDDGSAWSTPLIFSGTTSPQSRIVSIGGGAFDARIYAYNPLTGNNYYSNIITVI